MTAVYDAHPTLDEAKSKAIWTEQYKVNGDNTWYRRVGPKWHLQFWSKSHHLWENHPGGEIITSDAIHFTDPTTENNEDMAKTIYNIIEYRYVAKPDDEDSEPQIVTKGTMVLTGIDPGSSSSANRVRLKVVDHLGRTQDKGFIDNPGGVVNIAFLGTSMEFDD